MVGHHAEKGARAAFPGAAVMSDAPRIPVMNFGRATQAPVTRAQLDAMLREPAFAAFVAILSEAVIVVDCDDNIACINPAAERLSGVSREDAEQRPFEKFLRRSGLDLDAWLSVASKGRVEATLGSLDGSRRFLASRRVIPLLDSKRGYVVLTLREEKRGADTARAGAPPRSGHRGAGLMFPADLNRQIERAIRAHERKVRVILLGESGVGKTAVADFIHGRSSRDGAPFVHVNCGSIPETLFESEMFGYERGAFTGALQAGKKGFIESAAGGTLFLDEIGEIPLTSQAKLLKFLEDGTIQPIGSAMVRRVDVKVISATNRDLAQMVQEKQFRADLFYRISTFPVTIPALRERPDRGELIDSFLERINSTRKTPLVLTRECRDAILHYYMPGNIRELKGVLEYLDIISDDVAGYEEFASYGNRSLVKSSDVNFDYSIDSCGDEKLKHHVAEFEKSIINRAIESLGSKRAAARALGIDIATLIRKQQKT